MSCNLLYAVLVFYFQLYFLFVSAAFALNDSGHKNPFQALLQSFHNIEHK